MKSILIAALAIMAVVGMSSAYNYGYGYPSTGSSVGNGGSKYLIVFFIQIVKLSVHVLNEL